MCRDIWALHLSLLPNPPPAEPYFHTQGTEGVEGTGAKRGAGDDGGQGHEQKAGDSGSDGEGDQKDQELELLMREAEASSSSSSDDDHGEGGAAAKPMHPAKKGPSKRYSSRREHVASTISVLVLACWTMRIPVIYKDFIRYERQLCVYAR